MCYEKSMSAVLIVFLIVVAVLAVIVIGMYNSLIKLKNNTDEAWSGIDVQLKRRYNLIPNLLETVKGYAKHESETLENVVKARSMAMDAQAGGDVAAQVGAENMLTGALKSIFALSENYPDLKANANFLELQRELRDTEDKILSSRMFYNGNVKDFNTKQELFPTNIIAGMFGFKKRDLFEIEDEAQKKNVEVKF